MIDNIEIIKNLLNFENEGDFYPLMVLKRKKDQPEGEKKHHQSVRTIKTYHISNLEYLDERYDEIKRLCEMFRARAYINVQKQNHKDVSLNMMVELAERIRNGHHIQKYLFDSVVGKMKTRESRWVVDVDTKSWVTAHAIHQFINEGVRPDDNDKIEAVVPTKNGYHFITKRFDVKKFSEQYPNIDIGKKNPTILFIPSSLCDV
jgi:hypothetical protein